MTHTAYVDGACLGNPGPGGWGVFIQRADGQHLELSGREDPSTNNKMELMAAITAIERTPPGEATTVVTDSQYVKQGITTWIHGWKRKHWRTSTGDPVKNKELWQRLDAAVIRHGAIHWKWVKGHSGNPGNERADRLATSAARGVVRGG